MKMRGVEHEDITKYEKYHSYQDHIIEERERNVSELKLKLREKDREIEKLKQYIYWLENKDKPIKNNKTKLLKFLLLIVAIIIVYPILLTFLLEMFA